MVIRNSVKSIFRGGMHVLRVGFKVSPFAKWTSQKISYKIEDILNADEDSESWLETLKLDADSRTNRKISDEIVKRIKKSDIRLISDPKNSECFHKFEISLGNEKLLIIEDGVFIGEKRICYGKKPHAAAIAKCEKEELKDKKESDKAILSKFKGKNSGK
ncbi:MAG: hypothetical protein FWD15_01060 [Alphaproteobacteria bacterium]|nr:hypothetical protein [Alphaproteobacteria bacterium]